MRVGRKKENSALNELHSNVIYLTRENKIILVQTADF